MLNQLDGGFVEIYAGAQPATPDAPIGASVLLAKVALASPAFAAASGGTKLAHGIPNVTASANGIAQWFRAYKADGVTSVLDGSAGTAMQTPDMILNDASLTQGGSVAVTSWQFAAPAGQ